MLPTPVYLISLETHDKWFHIHSGSGTWTEDKDTGRILAAIRQLGIKVLTATP